MIPLELQDELESRFKKEFEHLRLKNIKGEQVPLNIFTQHLPTKDKSDVSHFPYMLIRLADGSDSSDSAPQTAKLLFIVGVIDRDNANQGYRDAIGIIQKIYQSLKRKPLVADRYELTFPMNWAYHDEDAEPYYFAGLETNWEIPKAIREDVEDMI